MDKEEKGFTCYWRIENFALFKKDSDSSLLSPVFRANMFDSCFQLEVKVSEGEYLAIYLSKVRVPKHLKMYFVTKCARLNYSVSLLTKSGFIKIAENIRHRFYTAGKSWGVDKLISWEKLEHEKFMYLPVGCLVVKFHMWDNDTQRKPVQCLIISRMLNERKMCHLPIEIWYDLESSDISTFPSSYDISSQGQTESRESQTEIFNSSCSQNNKKEILRLFQEKQLGLVTLKTSDKEFMVHKAVLCASSPVFEAMFQQDMQESANKLVDIRDMDSETVELLIRSLHFDNLENISWEKTVGLYYAADKYQIDYLKTLCISLFANELSEQNVFEVFRLADLTQDDDLKQIALNYFARNSKTTLRSREWKDFLSSYTELAADILHSVADDLYEV